MTSTKAHAIRSRSLKTSIGGVAILATTALVLSGCATTDDNHYMIVRLGLIGHHVHSFRDLR